ncbi:unnamed protein product [Calypogeia fissa]
MEFVEWQLFQLDSRGEGKELISPISLKDGPTVGQLSSIRSYLDSMNLIDFEFDFWNEKLDRPFNRKWEKANILSGPEIIIFALQDIQNSPKRIRIDSQPDSSTPPIEKGLEEGLSMASMEIESGRQDGRDTLDPCNINSPLTSPTTIKVPKSLDRTVPPKLGGPLRMRSKIMMDDQKSNWERAARGIVEKLEVDGKGDYLWWLETWDEEGHAVAKFWCQECQKFIGTGKVDQYTNTASNFGKQHIATKMHRGEYDRKHRLQKSTHERQERADIVALAIAHSRKVVKDNVKLIQDANVDEGSKVFIIDGDLENENVS